MPAPVFSQVAYGQAKRNSIQFGGQPSPIGKNLTGNNMTYLDLNDGTSWFAQGIKLPDSRILSVAQQSFMAKATWIAEDFTSMKVEVPFIFQEAVNTFASQRALLMTAGKQYLTFDQAATAMLALCESCDATEVAFGGVAPIAWKGTLRFLVLEPFFKDVSGSSNGPTSCAQSTGGGTTTNFSITYPGSFWCEPKWLFTTPNVGGNSAVTILNNISGESLTFTVPSDGRVYTVDCTTRKVSDPGGVLYDVSGAFPMLWPNLNSVGANAMSVTVVGAAGTGSLTVNWNNRWIG